METYILNVNPHTKPRMTVSDKWKHRTCVDAYYSFKDKLVISANKIGLKELPGEIKLIAFYIQMPESWSAKKKLKMQLTHHQQTPDCDNLLKSIQDCLMKQDCHIWSVKIEKYWANNNGFIYIEI